MTGEQSSAWDRGQSPVLGMILMVAIFVILAAVIGSFILGYPLTDSQTALNVSLQQTQVFDRAENIRDEENEVICYGADLVNYSGEVRYLASYVYLSRNATIEQGVRKVRVVVNGSAGMTVNVSGGVFRTPPVCIPPSGARLVALNDRGEVLDATTANATVIQS